MNEKRAYFTMQTGKLQIFWNYAKIATKLQKRIMRHLLTIIFLKLLHVWPYKPFVSLFIVHFQFSTLYSPVSNCRKINYRNLNIFPPTSIYQHPPPPIYWNFENSLPVPNIVNPPIWLKVGERKNILL